MRLRFEPRAPDLVKAGCGPSDPNSVLRRRGEVAKITSIESAWNARRTCHDLRERVNARGACRKAQARRKTSSCPAVDKNRKVISASSPLVHSPTIHVIDFFSGCGGTSAGFRKAGMRIRAGLDVDSEAAASFRFNFPEAAFFERDITKLKSSAIAAHVARPAGDLLLFSACAPCQPFSKQRRLKRRQDVRATLIWNLLRFVRRYRPDFLFLENVPGLRSAELDQKTFASFQQRIEKLGYRVQCGLVNSCDYGVPQKRRRLVLVASLWGEVDFPRRTHGPSAGRPFSTVWEWIGHFPKVAAGSSHPTVPNHRAADLSPMNLRRIKATPPGGSRSSWPRRLRLKCHQDYRGHTDVYGRMRKNALASGLTTRCISLSNGRFGHPVQNRAITVREAAALQTFDDKFVFKGTLNSMARQVGNAVPVLLAAKFGKQFVRTGVRCRQR